jgi:hypothetical protein
MTDIPVTIQVAMLMHVISVIYKFSHLNLSRRLSRDSLLDVGPLLFGLTQQKANSLLLL